MHVINILLEEPTQCVCSRSKGGMETWLEHISWNRVLLEKGQLYLDCFYLAGKDIFVNVLE